MRVHFTKEQIEFIMDRLEIEDPQEAMEHFMTILTEERIDPSQAPTYLKKLMAKNEKC